jgi:hypothetical protein
MAHHVALFALTLSFLVPLLIAFSVFRLIFENPDQTFFQQVRWINENFEIFKYLGSLATNIKEADADI